MRFRDHLEKLRYFHAICDAGSFRRAAEVLRLSQSSLTVAVKKLEDSVGTRLLIRTKSGIRPTAAGDKMLAFARDLAFRVEDLETRLRAPGEAVSGRLRIGAYDSIAIYWLPRVLRHLRERFPHVSLSISVGSSAALIERVLAGGVDVALVVAPPKDRRLRIDPLFIDHFSFFGTTMVQKEWARQRGSGHRHLIGMFDARVKGGITLSDLLREQGVDTTGALEVESFEIAKSLALQNVGVAVLPHRVAAFGTGSGRLVPVRGLPRSVGAHSICLVTPSEAASVSGVAGTVCEAMKALA